MRTYVSLVARRNVMSPRSTLFQMAAKTGMMLAALFAVTVLLAAIPSHRAPGPQISAQQESSSPAPEADHGMDANAEKQSHCRKRLASASTVLLSRQRKRHQ